MDTLCEITSVMVGGCCEAKGKHREQSLSMVFPMPCPVLYPQLLNLARRLD